ncbi:MAG: hypothetical protein ACYS19_12270, partial [Planctomycetota bacterium]
SVSAAATKVGLLAGAAYLATTKTAIVFTAGALTAGTIVATSGPGKQATEAPVPSPVSASAIGQTSNAKEEYWYYFPQGPADSMMLRVRSGAVGDKSSWQILQNSHANYHYHDNSVHINNARMFAGDLSVLKIPTDNPKFTDFLCQADGSTRTVEHIAASGRGLLVVAARNDAEDSNQSWAVRHYNVLEEDYFQGDWPATAKTIDNRDLMHRRRWTYFRVAGQINGKSVSGTGRIPFVYATSERYNPWLKLQVGPLRIVDSYTEAYLSRSASARLGTYAGGSFFKGLLRPWMGLHTIDTVRRDAAEQRIRFETKHTPGEPFAQVELFCKGARLVYKIDMEMDVIDEITFSTDKGNTGNLKFSYLQSIQGVGEEFKPPSRPRRRRGAASGPGLLWLVQLVEGSLG